MQNATKSVWQPVQVLEYLGVLIDSEIGVLFIPERRISKMFDSIREILSNLKMHRRVQARKLACFVSEIISMSVVVGHVAQIMTRCVSIDILRAAHWDSYVSVSEESLKQIHLFVIKFGRIK